jgi:hypothetical protein
VCACVRAAAQRGAARRGAAHRSHRAVRSPSVLCAACALIYLHVFAPHARLCAAEGNSTRW